MLRRNNEKQVAHRSSSRSGVSKFGLGLGTAVASIALAACTASAPPAETSFAKAQAALADGQVDQALVHAETAVLAAPRSASYRALLGAAYLEAGRFEAAATSFDDALALGDTDPRTVLSHALALTAAGDNRAALQTLDGNAQLIAPVDLGLAIALAGEPERGVHILVNEVRGGSESSKARQNLAYAYALAGNWRAARVMAAEDVPADQIDARLAEWAATAAPEAHRTRVATLLRVPSTNGGAMPGHLALSNFPSQEMMVAEAQDMRAQEVNVDVAEASSETMPAAIDQIDPDLTTEQGKPSVATLAPAQPAPEPEAVENAPAARVAQAAPRFVSNPVVQKAPTRQSEPAAKAAPTRVAKAAPQRRATIATGSAATHLVQLGSFDSRAVAQEKWDEMKKRFPALANRDVVITEAKVDGRTFFRLAAAGFGRRSAQAMCSTVKSGGRNCFAYAATNPPAGAVKRDVQVAARTN